MSTTTPDLQKKYYNVIVASGSGSVTLPEGMAHKLLQIVIIAPVSSTSFKMYIEETRDNVEVFRRDDDLIGTYNEIMQPVVPLFGNHILYITNASADGTFKVRIVYE